MECHLTSVRRVIASVRAILNLVIKEYGFSRPNIFNGVFIPKDLNKRERLPIPPDEIKSIQNECVSVDDELRWLLALISDTGMRLAEASGLLHSDIQIKDAVPIL